jgi:glutathione S-transferase
MAITFYHVRWCPECAVVRDKLEALKVPYEDVVVPDIRMFRKQVYEVSGQYYVPVVKDDDLVLAETRDILAYLDDRYGEGGSGPQAKARFASRTRGSSAKLDKDDQFPSCRRT